MICIALVPLSHVCADEPSSIVTEETTVKETTVKKERYLGVVTEPAPDALAAQFKDRLPAGHGLVVVRLLPDSPAEKAGVRPFDVLIAANDQSLESPEQLKGIVTRGMPLSPVRLMLLREAKTQQIEVLPGERTVSRLIHRYAGRSQAGKSETKMAAAGPLPFDDVGESSLAYAVGVQTRDGRHFQVDVSYSQDGGEEIVQKTDGTLAEITDRLKAVPASVRDGVTRQIMRVREDRQSLRSVRFRFTPRPEGQRQVLKATLRKPLANGVAAAFEWQQPLVAANDALPLQGLLKSTTFAAQLDDLDPAVRDTIEATLKSAVLPAARWKVESSQ